jgi:NAD(P)-dependent dehydrogenase (short-subunit alcohol dehydrogenase family)
MTIEAGPLAGRRVVVTGAAGGIGQSVATELTRQGASVRGIDMKPCSDDSWEVCDLSRSAQTDQAITQCTERLGGLDAVVNVAGGSGRSRGDGPVDQITDEGWDYALDTNLRSTFHVCRAALPYLGDGSSIVNLTSVLGLVGGVAGAFDAHAYAAAKGAVIALTRAMAVSYADRGIRVNAVAPGLVRTPMSARAQTSPQILAEAAVRQPLVGSLIEPSDVTTVIAFLVSPASAAITGVILPVDGGWTAQ